MAFMDDLTLLNPSINDVDFILSRLSELMNWACMKFKARKSRILVLKKGKVVEQYHIELSKQTTPNISEKPVKSLGRW